MFSISDSLHSVLLLYISQRLKSMETFERFSRKKISFLEIMMQVL